MHKGLSDHKIKKIMRYFCEDITASTTAILLGINSNSMHLKESEFRCNHRHVKDILTEL